MTYARVFNEEAIAIAKEHHAEYGDEIGSTSWDRNAVSSARGSAPKELAIWLFSMEDKRRIVDESSTSSATYSGFLPSSIGSYDMDAELVDSVEERYPVVKAAGDV